MINILISFDKLDSSRGSYFAENKKHLEYLLQEKIKSDSYRLIACENGDYAIDTFTSLFNGSKFVFVAYMHGSNDALYHGTLEFINYNNAYLFNDTFFCASSCYSANNLGRELKMHGCKIFVGYNKSISSVKNETEPIFVRCENSFIELFLTTDSTIQECMQYMYDYYQKMILFLKNTKSLLDASILESNLDSFEIICDDNDYNLTRQYFISNH